MTPDRTAWEALWKRLGAAGSPSTAFDELVSRYSEPHRHYHNLGHVGDCLAEFRPVSHRMTQADAVETALWFHDAVYDPRRHDNEAQSAALAERVLGEAGLAAGFVQAVASLILATQNHQASGNADAVWVIDVDLSIFGQPPERFEAYEQQIRREYDWVPQEAFAAGRAAILETFLKRPAIYGTDYFRDRYEARARANLARSIAQLEHSLDHLEDSP